LKLFEIARGHSFNFGMEAKAAVQLNTAVKQISDISVPRWEPTGQDIWAFAFDDSQLDGFIYGE